KDAWRLRRRHRQFKLVEPDLFDGRNVCRLRPGKAYDPGLGLDRALLGDLLRNQDLGKTLWRRWHGTILLLNSEGMRRISGKIQLQRVWISRPAAARAMLLHARSYLLPPRMFGCGLLAHGAQSSRRSRGAWLIA